MLGIAPSAWTPETWAAAAAWATVVVYGGLFLYAGKQVKEARKLREDQARPWVVAYFDVDWLTDIVIENIGTTVARDVEVRFDPPLASTFSRPWPWEESTLLTDGIKTLPPRQRVAIPFDGTIERFNRDDLPLKYTAHLTYKGRQRKPLTDTYVLDLAVYKGTKPPPEGLPEVVKALKALVSNTKRWSDGSGGLRVQASNRDRLVRQQDRHLWVDRWFSALKQDGIAAFVRRLVMRALQRRGWIR